jgi:hypothetical protein
MSLVAALTCIWSRKYNMWTLHLKNTSKTQIISTNAAKALLSEKYKSQVVPVVMYKMRAEGQVEKVSTGRLFWT